MVWEGSLEPPSAAGHHPIRAAGTQACGRWGAREVILRYFLQRTRLKDTEVTFQVIGGPMGKEYDVVAVGGRCAGSPLVDAGPTEVDDDAAATGGLR